MPRDQRSPRNPQRACALGLGLCIALGTGLEGANVQAKPKPPRIEANGGLVFQSQGGGTPNTFSGYLFAPLNQGSLGEVLFLDVVANLNLGGALVQQTNVNAGASTRLGYRWLSPDQRWMYGFNAGVDTRQAYTQYAFQAGVGAEALNRNVELRANGYIPFSNQADRYATGWTNAYLVNNQLLLDGWNRYVVSLGGVNLEAGVPLARWGKDSLWLYGSYYYLGGNYVTGSSGVRGRAEVRVGSQLSVGATLSYDNLFQLQATGYLRYGAKPIAGKAGDAVVAAERNFLALRGLPMQRETDIRMINVYQDLPRSVATNPGNDGAAWVVRCTGDTTNTPAATNVRCDPTYANNPLAIVNASTDNDVLLVGGGLATADISTGVGNRVQQDAQGRWTLQLPVGTSLASATSAPTVVTQFGSANLATIFGTPVGGQPSFSNGVISIGSDTTIAGFGFTNVSITNYSTSNVLISSNTFTGSYSPTPGSTNYNQNALPTIAFAGASNVTIAGNTFNQPNVQSYVSTTGTGGNVCAPDSSYPANTYTDGICLSGNAIRVGQTAAGVVSSNVTISGNTISNALDEGIRLDNVNGAITIQNNTITGIRNGPNTNMQAAIFIRQWSGSSQINVANNMITNNQPGINLIATGSSVASGTFTNYTTGSGSVDNQNVVDPLEIGLCRGNLTFSNRSGDKYGDDFGGFNCDQASPASMTYIAQNNTLTPSINSNDFDEDGIDLNVGSYGILNAQIINNNVSIRSDRNNAYTTDFRGAANVNILVSGNTLRSTNDPIDISAGTIAGLTSYANTGGTITITGNIFENYSDSTPPINLFDITTRASNLANSYTNSPPVTPIYSITALNNITIPSTQFSSANIDFSQTPNITNAIDFPLFYLNGSLLQ